DPPGSVLRRRCRSRVCRVTGCEIRLASSRGIAGARLRKHGPDGKGRRAFCSSNAEIDELRDVLQLRMLSGFAEKNRGSARMGGTDSREETDHAGLFAAAGTALVSQRERADQAPSGMNGAGSSEG